MKKLAKTSRRRAFQSREAASIRLGASGSIGVGLVNVGLVSARLVSARLVKAGLISVGLSCAVLGCAQVLDIPDDPQLVAGESMEQGTGNTVNSNETSVQNSGSAPDPQSSSGSDAIGSSRTDSDESEASSESRPLDVTNTNQGNGDSSNLDSNGNTAMEQAAADAGQILPALDAGVASGPQPSEPPTVDAAIPPDGCERPALRGPNDHCLLLVTQLLTWADARATCRAVGEGWDLVAIRSATENAFVATLSTDQVWIGASDLAEEATWQWVDDGDVFFQGNGDEGQAVAGAYVNWNPGEPNGSGGSGCARTVPNNSGTWADLECEFERAAVCQGPLPNP